MSQTDSVELQPPEFPLTCFHSGWRASHRSLGGESGRGKAQLFGGLGAPSLVISSNVSLGAAVKDSAERTEVDFEVIK